MKSSNGLLLIAVGLFILFVGIFGKFGCFAGFFDCVKGAVENPQQAASLPVSGFQRIISPRAYLRQI